MVEKIQTLLSVKDKESEMPLGIFENVLFWKSLLFEKERIF